MARPAPATVRQESSFFGLEGCEPETVDPAVARARVEAVKAGRKLRLGGIHIVDFNSAGDIVMSVQTTDFHSNGMVFLAYGDGDEPLTRRVYYSVGSGFVVDEQAAVAGERADEAVPYPFNTAAQLVALATENGCSIAALMAANEAVLARRPGLRTGILCIWAAMRECVDTGLTAHGTLPGALHVRRRARLLAVALEAMPDDPLYAMDTG